MGYDRGDRFPFNFEPNGIPFGCLQPNNKNYPNNRVIFTQPMKLM